MPKTPDERSLVRNAQTYFRNSERTEALAKQIRKKERAAEAAKTANLRRLRLEKEAAEKDAADKLAAETGAPRRKKPAPPKERKKPPVRLIY